MKLRVGVLQLDIALGDREKNKKKIADWMASVPLTPD
ncbi:MAG: carbon-nitrogen family hydrolase, partial [Synergistaceae bacterium]|nr:carbon-nitrogen family hydrolase [Synergistaceae bacterium]